MPLALAFIAIILLVAAVRGTQAALFAQLASDLPGYAVWLGAIILIGLIGFIPDMDKPSKALLALVILVQLLVNKGVFANLAAAFKSPPAATAAPSATATAPLNEPLPVQLNITAGSSGSAQAANLPAAAATLGSAM